MVNEGVLAYGGMKLSPKEETFFETKRITCEEISQDILKSCLSFAGVLEGSNEEKMGRKQKEEVQ